MPVHPQHPTLFYVEEVQVGWRLLYYRGTEVTAVERVSFDSPAETLDAGKETENEAPAKTVELIRLSFAEGFSDSWHPRDRVHAEPPVEG
jgi:hypothetical protein